MFQIQDTLVTLDLAERFFVVTLINAWVHAV